MTSYGQCPQAFPPVALVAAEGPLIGGDRENRTHLDTKVASPSRSPLLPPIYISNF